MLVVASGMAVKSIEQLREEIAHEEELVVGHGVHKRHHGERDAHIT